MNFRCPVCFYARLPYPPADYHICPSCGTEFGNDDQYQTYAQLRNAWVSHGALWFFREPPAGWDPWTQLAVGGYEPIRFSVSSVSPDAVDGFAIRPLRRLVYRTA